MLADRVIKDLRRYCDYAIKAASLRALVRATGQSDNRKLDVY